MLINSSCESPHWDFFPPQVTVLVPEITLLGTRKKIQRKRFTDVTAHNSVHDRKRSCEQGNSDPYLIPLCSSHNPEWVSESCSVMSDSLQPHGLYGPWNSLDQNTEWVAFPFSRGSSQPRDQTYVSCIAGRFFTSWATGKPITLMTDNSQSEVTQKIPAKLIIWVVEISTQCT